MASYHHIAGEMFNAEAEVHVGELWELGDSLNLLPKLYLLTLYWTKSEHLVVLDMNTERIRTISTTYLLLYGVRIA